MLILSFDCAYRSLAWSLIEFRDPSQHMIDLLARVQKSLSELIDPDTREAETYFARYLVAQCRSFTPARMFGCDVEDVLGRAVASTTHIDRATALHQWLVGFDKRIAAREPLPGEQSVIGPCDVDAELRVATIDERAAQRIRQGRSAVPDLVIIEHQPMRMGAAANAHSSVVQQQILYHYIAAGVPVIFADPKAKNTIALSPAAAAQMARAAMPASKNVELLSSGKAVPVGVRYRARKKQSCENLSEVERVMGWNLSHIAAANRDDVADSIMQSIFYWCRDYHPAVSDSKSDHSGKHGYFTIIGGDEYDKNGRMLSGLPPLYST